MLFSSNGSSATELVIRVERLIVENFGFHTDVILRSRTEIESVLKALEIKYSERSEEQKLYISFLKNAFNGNISLPLFSKNSEVEIIYHNTRDFFSISHLHKGCLLYTSLVFVVLALFLAIDLIFPLHTDIKYSRLILSGDGKLLNASLSTDQQWRMKAELQEVNPLLIKTLIYKEDRWFRFHPCLLYTSRCV